MKTLQEKVEIINRAITRYLPEQELGLYKAARHLIKAGGKRLRPVIAMVITEALEEDYGRIMPALVALEAIHNFTLIHDDIMDRDEMRRNVKTVHSLFGDAAAILAGDTLFAEAFKLLSMCDVGGENIRKALQVLSDVCVKICEGQYMDLSFETKMVKEPEYIEMVKLKTGALIAASSSLPAILFGKEEYFQPLWEYGLLAGIGFQIHDDVLDLIGKDIGKDWGSDLLKGKKTLIAIKAFERGVELETFGKQKANIEDIKKDVEKLQECGAIDYARNKAQEYIEMAKKRLSCLKNTQKRREIEELTDFLIKRSK
ncbi:MAG: polyprenyl synthetase family protein [Archaeoglobales archaeon]|nr:polyprenyl synthetase family protein [Archaeoglobales archaeon]